MAVEFVAASSQYISIAGAPILTLSGDFSVGGWVNPDDTTAYIIYSEGNSADNDPECMIVVEGGTAFRGIWRNDTGGGEIILTGANPPVGVWSHIAITRTGTTFTPYLNGVAGTPATLTMPSPITRDVAALGVFIRLTPANYFDGKLEDWRVFNRLLSAEEVFLLAAGYRGPLGGEVGWWSLGSARGLASGIDFDGTDDYVDCGSGATIDDIFDGGGSVSFWMNLDALPADGSTFGLMGQSDSTVVATGWILNVNNLAGAGARDNILSFRCNFSTGDGTWDSPDEQFTTGYTGVWTHIVVTYNADATTNDPVMYVNGTSITVTEFVTPSGTRSSGAAENFIFGRRADTFYFNGKMEDVRLFDRIITAGEVTLLAAGYKGPLGGEVLRADNRMAHPDGSILARVINGVDVNVIPDLSGNANVGTPYNSPVLRASEAPRFMPFWMPTNSNVFTAKTVDGALTFVGTIARAISKAFTGVLTFLSELLSRPPTIGVNTSLLIQHPADGSWWDLTGDVHADKGIMYEYGIRSNDIMDRTGTTGRMTFELDNDNLTGAYADWWTKQKAGYGSVSGGGPYTPGLKLTDSDRGYDFFDYPTFDSDGAAIGDHWFQVGNKVRLMTRESRVGSEKGGTITDTGISYLFLDYFADAEGTALASHVPDIGTSWTAAATGMTIESNKASDNQGDRLFVANATAADATIEADLVLAGGNFFGFMFRYVDSDHFLIAGADILQDKVAVWKNDGGSWSEIGGAGNGSTVYTNGDAVALKVVLLANSIKVYSGGTLKIDISNSFNNTATKHGLYVDGDAWAADGTYDQFRIS